MIFHRLRHYSELIVILLLVPMDIIAQWGWNWQNPLPQGNSLRDIQAFDQNTAIAVGNDGTVLRTDNGGISWKHSVSGTLNNLNSVRFINRQVGWAVGDGGTIIKTHDAGMSWVSESSGTSIPLTSIQFIDSILGWAVGGERLFQQSPGILLRTTDGGATWTNQEMGIAFSSVSFVSPTIGWAVGFYSSGGYGGGEILKTTNGGFTWDSLNLWVPDLRSVHFIDSSTGWVAGSGGFILKTTTGGMSWSTQASNTSNDLFSITFIDSTIGFAVGGSGTILKTTNGGQAWASVQPPDSSTLNSVDFVDPATGWIVGEYGTTFKSTNGGISWASQSLGLKQNQYSTYFLTPTLGWSVGAEGSVLKTTNGGNDWLSQATGVSNLLLSVRFVNQDTGWIVGSYGTILKTTDGGSTWATQSIATGNYLESVFFLDPARGWIAGDGGTILKTTNGGQNWQTQASDINLNYYSVFFTDENNGWVVGDYVNMLRTTNGGTTWISQDNGLGFLYSVMFINDSVGWAGGGSMITKTTNAGLTWQAHRIDSLVGVYKIFFLDENHGWGVGLGPRIVGTYNWYGAIVSTSDGGTTWATQLSGTSNTLWSVFFTSPEQGWIVGEGGTILHTNTGGSFVSVNNNWNMVSVPLTVSDSRTRSIFPTAISPAYAYNGGYMPEDTLKNGKGYWLKFNGAQGAPMEGIPRSLDSIAVSEGWNMIGSIGSSVAVSGVASDPGGFITSRFFGYEGNYSATDSIRPGKAYWVKVNQTGKLILTSSSSELSASNRIRIVPTQEEPPGPPDGKQATSTIPTTYALEQNYPNPFNPSSSISFTIPNHEHVRIQVFNLLGQLITTLVNQDKEPGTYSVTWDASTRSSGLYFYRMTAGEFVQTRKAILLR
jgi:photosystem II stability/assembly factor-like uncharacterized protein